MVVATREAVQFLQSDLRIVNHAIEAINTRDRLYWELAKSESVHSDDGARYNLPSGRRQLDMGTAIAILNKSPGQSYVQEDLSR